jgi:hypothetical protein
VLSPSDAALAAEVEIGLALLIFVRCPIAATGCRQQGGSQHTSCGRRSRLKLHVKQGNGANETGFCEALYQKTVGNKDDPL